MNSECKLERQSAHPTLSVRFSVPSLNLDAELQRAYATLRSYLTEVDVRPVSPAYAIYHESSGQDLDVEAGFAVDHPVPGKGPIGSGKLFEGDVATTIHTGPHQSIGSTYSTLMDWVHGRGLTGAAPRAEFYLDDPTLTPISELRTKVVLPVEPT